MNVNKELWEKWIINYKSEQSVLTRTPDWAFKPEFKQLGDWTNLNLTCKLFLKFIS